MKTIKLVGVLTCMTVFGSVAYVLGLASPSGAQTAPAAKPAPSETVIVNGQRLSPDQVIHNFIKSYAAPTFYLGKIARWADDICPKVSGLRPEADAFVAQRIKDIAAKAGARVATKTPCKINVEVVFTPQPQSFMGDIREHRTWLLGNTDDSSSKAMAMATVSHPVQAWYATHIRDAIGNVHREENLADCERRNGVDSTDLLKIEKLCGFVNRASLIADGISSEFTNVLVVADTNKISGSATAPLADYIAMLVLSQTNSFDTCQGLSTIANLMAANCAAQPNALTDNDAAYLKALYATDPDEFIDFQRGEIARRMEKSLGVR